MGMEKSDSEKLGYVAEAPLRSILPLILVDVKNIPSAEAKSVIKDKYSNFNFDNLSEHDLETFVAFTNGLKELGKEVVSKARSGRPTEAFQLASKIKTIDDAQKSYLTTPIKELLVFTNGDFKKVSQMLGVDELDHGQNWIEFMVRTWGMKPEDFRKNPEAMSERWQGMVENLNKFLSKEKSGTKLVVWPSAEIFKRLYIPEHGSLFRGMRGMSEESIESLLLDGVESNALRGNGDNTQTLGNNLKDSDISEEFHKHYKGAGKEDLFWQAPDDSPFVAFSQWRDVPLWHASREGVFRVIVELVPKFIKDTVGYHTLENTPPGGRLMGEDLSMLALDPDLQQIGKISFEHPFIYVVTDEVAFYPKVDPQDIAKIHLIPGEIKSQGINVEEETIPFAKRVFKV